MKVVNVNIFIQKLYCLLNVRYEIKNYTITLMSFFLICLGKLFHSVDGDNQQFICDQFKQPIILHFDLNIQIFIINFLNDH